MTKTKNENRIFQLVWNGSLFDKTPSLISGYRTDEKGFNGRLINQGKQVRQEWPRDFAIYTQGTAAVDYFLAGGFYDVVSDSVKQIIQEVASEEKVEFLPIKVISDITGEECKTYWVINVLENLDALDWKESTWMTSEIPYNDSYAYSKIIKPVMKLELIRNINIFHLSVKGRIKSGIFLTKRLKVALEAADSILGMEFAPVRVSPTQKDEPNGT